MNSKVPVTLVASAAAHTQPLQYASRPYALLRFHAAETDQNASLPTLGKQFTSECLMIQLTQHGRMKTVASSEALVAKFVFEDLIIKTCAGPDLPSEEKIASNICCTARCRLGGCINTSCCGLSESCANCCRTTFDPLTHDSSKYFSQAPNLMHDRFVGQRASLRQQHMG